MKWKILGIISGRTIRIAAVIVTIIAWVYLARVLSAGDTGFVW